jgi:hypothetical protein
VQPGLQQGGGARCWQPRHPRPLGAAAVPAPNFRLAGVAIGNGLTDPTPQTRALAGGGLQEAAQTNRLHAAASACGCVCIWHAKVSIVPRCAVLCRGEVHVGKCVCCCLCRCCVQHGPCVRGHTGRDLSALRGRDTVGVPGRMGDGEQQQRKHWHCSVVACLGVGVCRHIGCVNTQPGALTRKLHRHTWLTDVLCVPQLPRFPAGHQQALRPAGVHPAGGRCGDAAGCAAGRGVRCSKVG